MTEKNSELSVKREEWIFRITRKRSERYKLPVTVEMLGVHFTITNAVVRWPKSTRFFSKLIYQSLNNTFSKKPWSTQCWLHSNRLYLTKSRLLCSRILTSENGVPAMGPSTEVRQLTTTDVHLAIQRSARSIGRPMADWIENNSFAVFGHRNTHGSHWRIRVEKCGQMGRQRRVGKSDLHRRQLL